jgi:hypothetical protein
MLNGGGHSGTRKGAHVGKLKHQRRTPPRRPENGVKTRVKQRRAAGSSQGKLDRWHLGRAQ